MSFMDDPFIFHNRNLKKINFCSNTEYFFLQKLLEIFKDYEFLWIQDVNQTFEDFISGVVKPNTLRSKSAQKSGRQSALPATKFEKLSQASRYSRN